MNVALPFDSGSGWKVLFVSLRNLCLSCWKVLFGASPWLQLPVLLESSVCVDWVCLSVLLHA